MNALIKTAFYVFLTFTSLFAQNNFMLGNENLLSNETDLIEGKNLALVINKTSTLSNGVTLLDTLLALDFSVRKIFALEHGFDLKAEAGEKIKNTNFGAIPIISLYGKKKSPDKNDLENIDLILYDIQDVGARFYTYISSLKLIMQSAVRNQVGIIVLDRPNPQKGKIEGEILDENFKSFVGISKIPTVYGMTVGELAKLFADEIEREDGRSVKLTVVKMSDYRRGKNYFQPNGKLRWINPSPNLRTLDAALLYPGLCFLEATTISEGRGTEFPFEQFGAPFFDTKKIIAKLKATEFSESLDFTAVRFVPKRHGTYSPKFSEKKCSGVKIKIKDENFDAVLFGTKLLKILCEMYPNKISLNYNRLAKLYGNKNLERFIKNEISFEEIKTFIRRDREIFKSKRKNFLLYP
jgi:uncharacterized protein YbbC (DUF1343 family)